MPVYFDPTQAFNAFSQGSQVGGAIRTAQTNRKIGNAFNAGDYAEAASTAFGEGNLEGGMEIQKFGQGLQDAAAEKKRRAMMAAGMALLEKPEGPERQAYLPQVMGSLQAAGIELPPETLAALDLSDSGIQGTLKTLQDPETLMAQYQKAQEPYTLAPGSARYQGSELIAERAKEADPFTLSPGQVRYGPDGQEMARGPDKPQSNGITIGPDGTVQIGGPVQGLGYGSAPKGQDAAIAFDRDGNPVVTPGPQQEAYNKAFRGFEEFKAQNAIVVEDISRALAATNDLSAGGMAWTKDIPGIGGITPAGQLSSYIDTIQANVGFDKLQAMREASPTGGALGAVTERELAFLQSVFGSLRQDLSPENVRYNLTRLKQQMQGREQRLQEALAADFPSLATTAERRAGANVQVQELNGLYAPDGDPVTEDDIATTMQKYNMTREQVIARLRGE